MEPRFTLLCTNGAHIGLTTDGAASLFAACMMVVDQLCRENYPQAEPWREDLKRVARFVYENTRHPAGVA